VLSLVSFLRLAGRSLARIPGTVSDLLRPREELARTAAR